MGTGPRTCRARHTSVPLDRVARLIAAYTIDNEREETTNRRVNNGV